MGGANENKRSEKMFIPNKKNKYIKQHYCFFCPSQFMFGWKLYGLKTDNFKLEIRFAFWEFGYHKYISDWNEYIESNGGNYDD